MKSVKKTLITSAFFAVAGAACLMISLPFGGKAQAAQIMEKHNTTMRLNKLLSKGISGSGTILDIDADIDFESDNMGTVTGTNGTMVIEKGKKIENLDLDIGAAEFEIKKSKDDNISYEAEENAEVKVNVSGDTLHFEAKHEESINMDSCKVILYIPEDLKFDVVDIDLGASEFKCNVNFKCNKLDVDLGAGKAAFDKVKADEADLDVGAGSLKFSSLKTKDAYINVSAGDFEMKGDIEDSLNLNCAMGHAKMKLDGKESDHNYAFKVGMGTLKIGGRTISGVGSDKNVENGSSSKFDIDLGMGSVDIDFD